MDGKYIVIEGLEGAGKTTTRSVIAKILYKLGIKKVILTREPGGTQLAEKLRILMLNAKLLGDEIINNKAETLIFYAARAQLVETVIKPALAKNYWIISDRHDLSTQAYQGIGCGFDSKMLTTMHNIVLNNFRPDLTFYLDVTPEIGLKRIRRRSNLDRIEQKSLDFFNRVRNRYLELSSQDNNIQIIDANQSLEKVIFTIHRSINQWFLKNCV